MANSTLLELSQEEIAVLCAELEHAIAVHNDWVQQFHRSLVTVQKIPASYIQENSHNNSDLGIWLEQNKEFVSRNKKLQEIESLNLLMHEKAIKLAHLYNDEQPIQVEDYDAFIEHKALLGKTIHDLQDSLKIAATMFDDLTGAFIRSAMEPLLSQELYRIKRKKHASCVSMLDLDYFKSVNDTYGHMAGDRVLHASAEFIKNHMRPYDSLFRYGGEEFLICLAECSTDDALVIMNRIREGLSSLPMHIDVEATIYVTASAGIATLTEDAVIETCISQADQALYAAKEGGRNRVMLYGDKQLHQ